MMKSFYLTALTLLSASTLGLAQIKTPAPSPTGKFSQDVGLIKVEVEYSRPSIKGRKIFGDLVPFGELWRTGANASTKVTFSDDVQAANVSLPKGTYALYTIPGESQWTIIFYKDITIWGAPEPKDFKDDQVAGQFKVPVQRLTDKVETFTINVGNLTNNGADLELIWENTKVAIPITVGTDEKVMSAIKSTMEGPSANDYYAAARYYYESKKDLKQALTWVNSCLEKGGEKFWILRLKANILGDLGMYNDAITTANRSTELAKADGNTDYPRMNEKSVMEWKKKM